MISISTGQRNSLCQGVWFLNANEKCSWWSTWAYECQLPESPWCWIRDSLVRFAASFLVIPFQQIFKVSNHTVCPWERQCWRFYWIPPSRWADELGNGWELAKRVCVPKTVHESIASGWDPQHTICCWWDIDGRYHFIFNWNGPKCFISLARHWWPRPQNLLD